MLSVACSEDSVYLATNHFVTNGYWGTHDDRDFDGYDNIRFFLRTQDNITPDTRTITFLVGGLARDTLPPVVLHFDQATLSDGHNTWKPVAGGISKPMSGTANPSNGQTRWDEASVTFANHRDWYWGWRITPQIRKALQGQGDLVLSFPATVPNPAASVFGNAGKVPAMREVLVQFVWSRREQAGQQRFRIWQG
ncbi:MAG TPA: hypothetical protein VIM96_08335 [Pseudomonadales bacterium]